MDNFKFILGIYTCTCGAGTPPRNYGADNQYKYMNA